MVTSVNGPNHCEGDGNVCEWTQSIVREMVMSVNGPNQVTREGVLSSWSMNLVYGRACWGWSNLSTAKLQGNEKPSK